MRVWLVLVLIGGVAAAGPPHGAKRIAIDYTYSSFHHDEKHYVIEWTVSGYVSGKRAVDGKAIDAIYAALTDLHDTNVEQSCFSHTDDYPDFSVTIDGDEPLVVASKSNCHGYVPWMITRKTRMFAQYNGKAGRAVQALLAAVDPDHWKTPPDSPEATFGLGREHVRLAHYDAGDTGTEAASCAHELETDARSRKLFGEAIHVTELALVCDLAASPECTRTIADTTFRWAGIAANVELACTGGHVDFAAVTTAVTELRPVVESKPVRTLVRLSSHTPRMFQRRTWRILPDDETLPDLDYDPRTRRIDAHGIGEHGPSGGPFWKAFGLDPGKLTTNRDGYSETSATFDLDGHVTTAASPSP